MTFVEMLSLIVVLLILVAIAIPTVSPVVQWFRLRGSAWQLAGDLRLARQRAVTLQKRFRICVTSCAITVPAGSYSLERDNGTPFSSQWVSETGATIRLPGPMPRLPSDVTISATASAATFNQTGIASGATFTLTNLLGTYEVRVASTGRVIVCQGTCP
jgi:Tfp pilus assembly protein FimT